ncbi:MAG TPA: hypothetical protein VMU30_02175 [Bacteroidota bacterium]|nr:hypothetical protein [Bacteroidota bacterium]
MKRSFPVLLISLISIVALACNDYRDPYFIAVTSPPPHETKEYLRLYFADTTSLSFMFSFLDTLNVPFEHVYCDPTFELYMKVDSGNYTDDLAAFLKDSSVAWDMKSYPLYTDSANSSGTFILVKFKDYYTVASNQRAVALAASIGGLRILEALVPSRDADILIPKFQEQAWINRLKQYPWIKEVEPPVTAVPG